MSIIESSVLVDIISMLSPQCKHAVESAIAVCPTVDAVEVGSKGCDYCNGIQNLYYVEDKGTWAGIYITNGELMADLCKDYASVDIKYCPMCGAKMDKAVEG